MKNVKIISVLAFMAVCISATIIISCSRQRVQDPALNTYNSPNSYLDSKKQQEQEFTITSDTSSSPIIGNQGSKIAGSRHCLMFPNGDTVALPWKVKLVELYTPKDMIYYQMPTVASGNILETDGEIRVRAFKNNTELVLKPGCSFYIEMPNAAPKNYMRVHYGFGSTNWTDNPATLGVTSSLNPVFSTNSYGYLNQIAKLGWINCGVNASSSPSSALSFTSTVDDLTNVAIFIYIPAKKTVMQVSTSLTSDQIPNGTNVKVIALGVDGGGQLFSFDQNVTVNSNMSISVTLSSTTDANFTALLNGL